MTVVALRLAGPLQSWGAGSRFVRRGTENEPTKSGVLGLVAAAKGMRRTDPLTELLGLRFGVRVDKPGKLVRDFHTAQKPRRERDGSRSWTSLPLSYRYYQSDAAYLAVLEGQAALVEGIDAALRRPHFPLYLGRRSCPSAGPIALGVFDEDLTTALAALPWLADERMQRSTRTTKVRLAIARDAFDDEAGAETIRDTPQSFDPHHRSYAWRTVIRDYVDIANPHGTEERQDEHDPMTALRE